MTYFTFTTTDHELTLRERAEMRERIFVATQRGRVWWEIPGFTALVSMLGEYASVGMLARVVANPAIVGALTLVLVVGLGGALYRGTQESASDTVAREVATATTTALSALEPSVQPASFARRTNEAIDKAVDTQAALPAYNAPVPSAVTQALSVIDAALTSSSVASDVPLARIVASLASLESVAQTHVENGTGTAADEAVLAFVEDKKPLLTLLVSTASDEEKLAIHTAAAEFILRDVRAQNEEQGVFAEAWLATRDTNETATLLDDLSTVKAVAQQTPAQTL